MTRFWISCNFNYWADFIFKSTKDLLLNSLFCMLIIRILRLGLFVVQIIEMIILTYNRLFRVLFLLLILILRIHSSYARRNFASWRSSALTKGCRSSLINVTWWNTWYSHVYLTLLILLFRLKSSIWLARILLLRYLPSWLIMRSWNNTFGLLWFDETRYFHIFFQFIKWLYTIFPIYFLLPSVFFWNIR
jgi:hypothetical protein